MVLNLISNEKVSSRIDLLSAWIESQMAYKGQPGLSIGIVYDQELVWARGFGYADVENDVKATSKTIYRIASITKLFTSTAIMQLRDAGKLRLDDPIKEHLPWFNIKDDYPDSPPITISHLLTHTSGLPREAAFPYWTDSKFPSRKQIRETLAKQETILPTETKWKYSNLALTLAGEIVSSASEQEYADYIRHHILDPLGMGCTYVESPELGHPMLAKGYGRRLPDGTRSVSPFTDSDGITPAANMSTTVEDLAKFAMLQFRDESAGGRQILRGSTLREMHRVHWLQPDWQTGWGLGFNIVRVSDQTFIGHGGAVQGYRTHLRISLPDKIAVIVLTNSDDGNPLMYVEKAFQWLPPAVREVVDSGRKKAEIVEDWQKLTGKYRSAWNDLHVLILDGDLVMIDPSQPDPTLEMTKLVPVSENVFRMDEKSGYGSHGELAVFELDEEGKVWRVKTGENYIYPQKEW